MSWHSNLPHGTTEADIDRPETEEAAEREWWKSLTPEERARRSTLYELCLGCNLRKEECACV